MTPASAKRDRLLPAEVLVGQRLRALRAARGCSLRALAEASGLNVNTLCLIENGKSSASIGTLQQIALALEVPLTALFETAPSVQRIVFTPASPDRAAILPLGKDLADAVVQPFRLSLLPGLGSGDAPIVHTGHEFVYLLSGALDYRIADQDFHLQPGDSLVFEAPLPHHWHNPGPTPAEFLLVLFPADRRESPGDHHFAPGLYPQELTMKIALITDDGQTISQHFGRATHYLVLTIEDGQITGREMRPKLGHNQLHQLEGAHEEHHDSAAGHGTDPASHDKHVSMAETIADCQVLLCGGMGRGAYESMRRLNIQPVVTQLRDVDAAAQAFLDGKLVDHTELLH
jgi:transcriptional regulator with XRE-family HTH domain/predicted Fe-Mo cluster-binding NifX family protein